MRFLSVLFIKQKFVFLLAGLMCLLAGNVAAITHVYNAEVADVRIDRSGKGIIKFGKALSDQVITCPGPSYSSHLSFDVTTDGGRAIYAMALAAVASGKTVTAYGAGTCSEYGTAVESLSYWRFFGS